MKQALKVGKVHRLMDEAEQIRKHATLPHLTTDQRRALMREADKYESKARWLAHRNWTAREETRQHER